jgi:hypothetical protein
MYTLRQKGMNFDSHVTDSFSLLRDFVLVVMIQVGSTSRNCKPFVMDGDYWVSSMVAFILVLLWYVVVA